MTSFSYLLGMASTYQKLRQASEPYSILQDLGFLPFGLVLVVLGGLTTLLLLDNKRLPAALVVVLGGMFIGLIFVTYRSNAACVKFLPFHWGHKKQENVPAKSLAARLVVGLSPSRATP